MTLGTEQQINIEDSEMKMIHSDDDVQPLIDSAFDEHVVETTETSHILLRDVDSKQVVYGYRKSRWRILLMYMFCFLTAGIPLLVFHWVPKWYVYLTCVRCCFEDADKVVIVETYQKKCMSFYIHKIRDKNVADTCGVLNAGFQDDIIEEKSEIENTSDAQISIPLDDGTRITVSWYRFFRHKKQTFVWVRGRGVWRALAGAERGARCDLLHNMAAMGNTDHARARMLNVYGLNEIKVPLQTVFTLVLLEVSNPFYVFQLFTIGVWLAEKYYWYCIAVVIMSLFGIITSVVQTKKNQQSLRATVEAYSTVQLWGGRAVDSRLLAPGDIVTVTSHSTLLYDAVLVSGGAIVNESMLTGESVPVTKSSVLKVDKPFDMTEHASNILFCGTRVLQHRPYNNEPVKALVLRTGYHTSKGQLIRSILYPVPADFKFDRDSYKFIFILAIIALVGVIYAVILKSYRSMPAGDIALKALDILTIVVSPALPAAMTVGRLYAVTRLKKARISCLNTRAVNVSGSLDCVCFDKTGTLTEDGLDMWGVVSVSQATNPPTLSRIHRDPSTMNDLADLKMGMASCHSLTLLDGELRGDPLDLKMFESTGWMLEDVADSTKYQIVTPTIVRPSKKSTNINVDDIHLPLELGIVHQYQFVSSLQRSSVAVKTYGEDVLRIYCKGAPETLSKLCRPETVPDNLNKVLSEYAEKGYRVIAVSTRMMEVTYAELQKMTREEVEKDLEFLGLVILENRLKPATTPIIRELKEANIKVVMITGDNIHTGVSVGKECGILSTNDRVVSLVVDRGIAGDEPPRLVIENWIQGSRIGESSLLSPPRWSDDSGLGAGAGADAGAGVEEGADSPTYNIVMTGDAWQVLRVQYPSLVGAVIERGAVFARMTAEQKQQLILEYQALGYYVGMCGDGANDCGALRAAHAGVSLSALEASVAAPFTCARADISGVAHVLREGRAALSTSFGVFKFMIGYSLTEFFSVAFLYYFDSNLTDFQFLFIDVALIVNFAFFFGMTEAYTGRLCKTPPLTSLLGIVPLTSLIGQIVLIAVAQYLSYYALTLFPWYVRHTYTGEEENECWENYAIFAVSLFQYIILVLAFSHGAPYRRSVITNKLLMFSVLIMTGLSLYIAIWPAKGVAEFMQLKMPEDKLLSYIVIIIAAANFIVALLFERFIIQYLMTKKELIPKFLKMKKVRKTPYLTIRRQLTNSDYLDAESSIRFESGSDTTWVQST